jgi:hypothetical protein
LRPNLYEIISLLQMLNLFLSKILKQLLGMTM